MKTTLFATILALAALASAFTQTKAVPTGAIAIALNTQQSKDGCWYDGTVVWNTANVPAADQVEINVTNTDTFLGETDPVAPVGIRTDRFPPEFRLRYKLQYREGTGAGATVTVLYSEVVNVPTLPCAHPFYPEIAAVTNSATFQTSPLIPGSIMTVWLKAGNQAFAQANTTPWPTRLGGVEVHADGLAFPVGLVYGTQINFQVPATVSTSGGHTFSVSWIDGGGNQQFSPAIYITADSLGPALYAINGQPVIQNYPDYKLNSASSPVASSADGKVRFTLWGMGLGPTTSNPPAGEFLPVGSLSPVLSSVKVDLVIDGVSYGRPAYVGLAQGLVGIYQINLELPFDNGFLNGLVGIKVKPGKHSAYIQVGDQFHPPMRTQTFSFWVGPN